MTKKSPPVVVQLVVCAGLVTALAGMAAPARRPFVVSSHTTGGPFEHEVVPGDSLVSLGARHGIDAREIALANGLKQDGVIKPGLKLWLDNRHIVPVLDEEMELVINVPQRLLFLMGRESVGAYPVALGRRDWPTPLGEFSVVSKEENPTWDVPASIQAEMRRQGRPVVRKVPPGPANPLGSFWLGLSIDAVGIHGTNAPLSIFRHVTHGCVRVHPGDIADLYSLVPLGARGRILYEPVLLAETAEGIFLEAHPDVYRRMTGDALSLVREAAEQAGISCEIDWSEAAKVLHARRGVGRLVSVRGGQHD
jgi:L,D-transpeptidase ErfK/SrfK